jgi:adenine-specific DNA methylase
MRAMLTPFALKDAPALIETVFPGQKVSFEAQRERKSGSGQILTALGSYWKGRKPLILVRAVILGSLLVPTEDANADLAIFEKLMAFDDESLARRALIANTLSVTKLQELVKISDPNYYFNWHSWPRTITIEDKLALYRLALAALPNYAEKASIGKRPEELDQNWLYAPIWEHVNHHYAHLGVNAHSIEELTQQLGILRYGRRPRVGDTFSGGGSIPFEAARIGCDVYASDLNPVACMLTWGNFHVIGAPLEKRREIEKTQKIIAATVANQIKELGVEHDEHGNRAKMYLYCLETRCPETGWMIPMAPSWVISKMRNVIARLIPNHEQMRFDISICTGVSAVDLNNAELGTIQKGNLVYVLDGKTYRTPIKTLRGDYRNAAGSVSNRLRPWEKSDFQPRSDDIFQERLYAIQWITKDTLNTARQNTYFAVPTVADLARETHVQKVVAENLIQWMSAGLVPDMMIEPGEKTDELIRTRGWTYWHHLFNPRQLLLFQHYKSALNNIVAEPLLSALTVTQSKSLEWNSRLCIWATSSRHENQVHTFSNQALNTLFNYATRATSSLESHSVIELGNSPAFISTDVHVLSCAASDVVTKSDLYITDPPYADAVSYHEITEFFIAWLRKKPPKPFDDWVWDSRRVLAIKGTGDEFRRSMISAYKAMVNYMSDNGMQCVMFTHQSTGVWNDLIGIFWAVGLQVVAAWYIATETTSELKKGGYVQGTVILMLKKREVGERNGFKQRLLPAVRQEVAHQIEAMMHLNDTVKTHHGEPVFNDADLQMAGYAAALKVLTAYTHIGGDDITNFALRSRVPGEVTVVDEIVHQATEIAANLLVPQGLSANAWTKLVSIERFVLRMLDMEATSLAKLDDYQNFAKAFRVGNYNSVMGSIRPGYARLKRMSEYTSHDLAAHNLGVCCP